MTGLIKAEYLKLRKRTFFWVVSGLIWAFTVLFTWLVYRVFNSEAGGGAEVDGFTVSIGGGEGTSSSLIALLLSIQILGGEFSGGR